MNNLWNDDLTQSIASTVSDVLEGKVKIYACGDDGKRSQPSDHSKLSERDQKM